MLAGSSAGASLAGHKLSNGRALAEKAVKDVLNPAPAQSPK